MKKPALILLVILSGLVATAQDINAIISELKSDEEVADTLFYFGRRYMMRGKNDSALIWMERGLETAKKMNDDTWIARFLVEKSNVTLYNDKKLTLAILKEADEYMKNVKDYRVWQKYYMITAKCYRHMLKLDFALEYYKRCEKLNNENNPYSNWIVYLELGEMLNEAESVNEAESYFEKSYALTKSKGVRMDYGLVLAQLANFYSLRNKPEQFAWLLNEYKTFLATSKMSANKDPFHSMLFIEWGDTPLDDKVNFMKKVAARLLANGDYTNAAYTNHNIEQLYENNGQLDIAIDYMRICIEISRKDEDLYTVYSYSGGLYRLLKKVGKNEEATIVADQMFILKDSILKKQQREIVLDLETKYQTERKEKEIRMLNTQRQLDEQAITLLHSQNSLNTIKLLREAELHRAVLRESSLKDSVVEQARINNGLLLRENALKNSELEKGQALSAAINRENDLKVIQLSREKKTRGLLVGGAGLLLVAGFFIFALYAKQRRKNDVIEKQSTDMQVLLKEIHHRVKNNLQVISSLLDLQSMTIKDNQASEAVKEGKNRVHSMALIHQNLYSEDNLKGIRAKQYIDNLLQSLCDSYSISKERVLLRSEIDDIKLDVDTMIPLGLILNELVSNSLKYAFKDNQVGQLEIVLRLQQEHLFLRVKDNGAGFPEGIDAKTGRSFGLKMIRAFAQKLKAKLDIYNQDGAVVEMQITKFNLA